MNVKTLDTPRRSASGNGSLTPEQWVEAATELLVDGGVELVRVDVVAKQLGVTRGSFYWHFKDRSDLLQHVLQAWRMAATEQVTTRFERNHPDPKPLLRELLSLPLRGRSAVRAARIELAIRDWARRDPMARSVVDEADARRVSYIAQCFSSLGFGIAEARSRASILYAYEVGVSMLQGQGTAAQRVGHSALLEQLLLTAPPAQ